MERAHEKFLDYDRQLEDINNQLKASSTSRVEQKKPLEEKHGIIKTKFDGEFTELKRAQDALNKSSQQRRKSIDKKLRDKADSCSEINIFK